MHFKCPHCKGKTNLRTSHEVNALMRELMFICLDPECGHTFVAYLEAARTLSPSAMPDPLVYLPMSENTRRQIAKHPTFSDKWRAPSVSVQPGDERANSDVTRRKSDASTFPMKPDAITAALHPGMRPTAPLHHG